MKIGPKPIALALVLLALLTVASEVTLMGGQEPALRAWTASASYNSTFNISVTDQDGRPIGPQHVGPATVKIIGNITTPLGWQTNANGSVLITGIYGNSTGITYYIAVEAKGFNTCYTQAVAIQNRTANVSAALIGGQIWGTVTSSSTPAIPIKGAVVSIEELGSSYSNKTNKDGQYFIRGVPMGSNYTLLASATDFYPKTYENVSVSAATAPVNFALNSRGLGHVDGTVRSGMLLLVKANVSVVGTSAYGLTEPDGTYDVPDIPPGTYTVQASKPGYFAQSILMVNITGGNTTTLNFNLTQEPTMLHGTVRSGTLLLVRANVSIAGTTLYYLSGPDGTYNITNITAGTYTVQASRPGYVTSLFVNMVIGPGDDKELNINLSAVPGAILRGVVSTLVGNAKKPLVDVKVTLVTTNATENSTATNIYGEFAFTGLTPGNYTVLFELASYRPMQVSGITVTNGSSAALQFVMTPLSHGFSGFIFGFDLPHSLMILGLFLTIAMLGVAVYLRIRTIQLPGSGPAVYDDVEDEMAEEESAAGGGDLEDRLSETEKSGKG